MYTSLIVETSFKTSIIILDIFRENAKSNIFNLPILHSRNSIYEEGILYSMFLFFSFEYEYEYASTLIRFINDTLVQRNQTFVLCCDLGNG